MTSKVCHAATKMLAVSLIGLSLLGFVASASAQDKKANSDSREIDISLEAKVRLLRDLEGQVALRRAGISREEERLTALKAALEGVKRELRSEREALEELKREAEDAIARRDRLVDERLEQIARVYQAMKPKEAARVLEEMEEEMAVAILERIASRNVARIFNVMPKARVIKFTHRLEKGGTAPQ